ncbi:hypothetical protein MY1884_005028 [Beauveria asiatica]
MAGTSSAAERQASELFHTEGPCRISKYA